MNPRKITSINYFEKFYKKDDRALSLICLGLTDDEVITYLIPFLEIHPEIKSLTLMGNFIKDKGIQALVEAKTFSNIIELDVSGNLIGDEGAKILAATTNLLGLDIGGNPIGINGFKALANMKIYALEVNSIRFHNEVNEFFSVKNPYKRAQNALDSGMNLKDVPVPSLKDLSLFAMGQYSPNTNVLPEALKQKLRGIK